MRYRTKQFDLLYEYYLIPIFKFVGLTIYDEEGVGMIRYIDSGLGKDMKPVMKFFMNHQTEPERIYTLVRTLEEHFVFKDRFEELEYFNPFIKTKNTTLLLMMFAPIVYERCCRTDEGDLDDILMDEEYASIEEISKAVNIRKYPTMKNKEGEIVHLYEISINIDTGETITLSSQSTNNIAAMIMLMMQIIEFVNNDEFIDEIENYDYALRELLEKYNKERTLNNRDLKNLEFETQLDYKMEEFDEDGVDFAEESLSEMVAETADDNEPMSNDNKQFTVLPIHHDQEVDTMLDSVELF